MSTEQVTWDANEATADVAFRINEVIAIYPITPSSAMGEHADAWSAKGRTNVWGEVPRVLEMQSEGGAAGAVHGSLQAGALTTTFTASQGLLLMIPNYYKIAGELTSAVIHVAARTIATHALSIFGDHSDIYAARQTGMAMLSSSNGQQAHDFAAIAQYASLETRIPFIHFFDGFRTSHEVSKTWRISDDELRAYMNMEKIEAHRKRGLSPDAPVVRGTAQNPDVFFQAREAINPYYARTPGAVQDAMDRFSEITGRSYKIMEYYGHPEAERVIVVMGSAGDAISETIDWLASFGQKVGVLLVHLYRPFSAEHLLAALPKSVKTIGVLDRTKEPGAPGEPLYLDVMAAITRAHMDGTSPFATLPNVVGGRYGLSSKEFNPGMIAGIYEALAKPTPPNGFTVGIIDDISHTSLPRPDDLDIEAPDVTRAVFWGLGSDGTVGANKNSIKIIGEQTENYAQGYFVYDSKKAGAVTISHLRFGPRPIRSSYLIRKANFLGCHQWGFLSRYNVLERAANHAVFLVNSPYGPDEVWDQLPIEVQQDILAKELSFYVIDAYKVARDAGMPGRINTIMQTCFFAISGVLPREEAIDHIKKAIVKSYSKKGEAVVAMNNAMVDNTLAHLFPVPVPGKVTSTRHRTPIISEHAPDFVQRVTGAILAGHGDDVPVSAFPVDGTWPSGTTKWEKRGIAEMIPVWDKDLCIQCNKCAMVCPHAAIRAKVYDPSELEKAPEGFNSMEWKAGDFKGMGFTIQVAPEDCTGCQLCAVVCPAVDKKNPGHKSLDMVSFADNVDRERVAFDFFDNLPEADRLKVRMNLKETQLLQPLFEYSGACAGCGETPYIKLLTQLFGDRTLIANATGCSSIYGGNLPTTPYTTNADGRGPAWANSLFEDNAEFGMGFRLALDSSKARARRLLGVLEPQLWPELVTSILDADQEGEANVAAQRERVETLRTALASVEGADARALELVADHLVDKAVWIVGGDGWAYDIGFGGLDHAIASGMDINILVLDTEVYSNTGGQSSKATPLGAVAKFAAGGKPGNKKDLGMIAMGYGNVYVAQVAFGAKDAQTVSAFVEAAAHKGPSLIIAYSPCIEHGYNLTDGLEHQKQAVSSGYWPLYRHNPANLAEGKAALKLDSNAPKGPFSDYAYTESRFKSLLKTAPERAKLLMEHAQQGIDDRFARYDALSKMKPTEE